MGRDVMTLDMFGVVHSAAACVEGWDLFETPGSGDGTPQLQALYDPPAGRDEPILPDDLAAWKVVMQGVAEGRPHAVEALAILARDNPEEWARVVFQGAPD